MTHGISIWDLSAMEVGSAGLTIQTLDIFINYNTETVVCLPLSWNDKLTPLLSTSLFLPAHLHTLLSLVLAHTLLPPSQQK